MLAPFVVVRVYVGTHGDGDGVGVGVGVGVGIGVGVMPGDIVGVGVGVPNGTEFTAASASTRPYPNVLFGICVEGIPAHVCTGVTTTFGFAVFCRIVFVAAISRWSCGRADQSRATTPTT
jgi:hypothetical protein